MQFLDKNPCAGKEYRSGKLWWDAAPPEQCPYCPQGGCQWRPHGTYGRKDPPGMRVRRFRCSESGRTISLLPQFLAARQTGTLKQVERVLDAVHKSAPRPPRWRDLHPAAAERYGGRAVRWAQRRLAGVGQLLVLLPQLLPLIFAGWEPTWAHFAERLQDGQGSLQAEPGGRLVALRLAAEPQLDVLPAPVGFGIPASKTSQKLKKAAAEGPQHAMPRGPPA